MLLVSILKKCHYITQSKENLPCTPILIISTLKIEAECSSRTLVFMYKTTRSHNPADHNPPAGCLYALIKMHAAY
jgi:hypothetical protein